MFEWALIFVLNMPTDLTVYNNSSVDTEFVNTEYVVPVGENLQKCQKFMDQLSSANPLIGKEENHIIMPLPGTTFKVNFKIEDMWCEKRKPFEKATPSEVQEFMNRKF